VAVFTSAVTDPGNRPAWLLNVSNDAWFGASIGPHQHFAMARMRALEEGLPLARAANTGISAVVDGYGRVIGALGLEEMGVIEAPLPRALPQPTPYARFGDLPLALLLTAGMLGALLTRRQPAVDARKACPPTLTTTRERSSGS
jgi:apolipoprotein N-acyltransferase